MEYEIPSSHTIKEITERENFMTQKEACEVLGLSECCTDAEVSEAFMRLAMACHPPKGGTAYLFRKISEVRDALKNKWPTETAGSSSNREPTPPRAKKEERKPIWREIVLDTNSILVQS